MPLNQDSSKLRVVHHDPVREKKIKIITAVSVVVLGVLAYWIGGNIAGSQNTRLRSENEMLEQQVIRLRSENDHFRQQLTILESSSKIDREAVNNVRSVVRELQENNARLEKELAYYKNILAPEDMRPGVRVAGLELEPGSSSGHYRMRLVISQIARDNPLLRGTVAVTLEGKNSQGKTETLSLLKLAGYEGDTAALGFRYFQAFPDSRGFMEFHLPEGFTPESIRVNLSVRRGANRNVEKIFDWNKELTADVQ